jgi:hypothetical protein
MSKEHGQLKDEDSETAFLVGVIDVLSDNLSLVGDYACALDADVFYIKGGDISLLNSAMKKRLRAYNEIGGYGVPYEKIESLNITLEKQDRVVDSSFLCDMLSGYSSSSKLGDAVEEFLCSAEWHLGKPKCAYFPITKPDKDIDTLGRIYLYAAWKYFFISYSDYIVMIILGSVE